MATAERVRNSSKNKKDLLPGKTPEKKTAKNYCGTCPACMTLKSMPVASPEMMATVLKRDRAVLTMHHECITGFLQKVYGNNYTWRTLEILHKSGAETRTEPKPEEKKILRSPAGVKEQKISWLAEKTGTGSYLDYQTRSYMESRMGHPLGDIKIHNDSQADHNARSLNAQAYTVGRDIFFTSGKYKPESFEGRKLLAHELAHAVQNRGLSANNTGIASSCRVSLPGDATERHADAVATSVMKGNSVSFQPPITKNRNTIYRKKEEGDIKTLEAPASAADLKKATFEPPYPVADYLDQQGKSGGSINVSFGRLAQGTIHIRKKEDTYNAAPQIIPLAHPLFKQLEPGLVVSIEKNVIKGHISPIRGNKAVTPFAITSQMQKTPEILGLPGFVLPEALKIENRIEGGVLKFGGDINVSLGGAFDGRATIRTEDEKVTFQAKARINVKGLAEGEMALNRADNGLVTGTGDVGMNLSEKYAGKVHIVWNGKALSGEGEVGYKGEKLQGNVTVKMMEKSEADAIEAAKKAPEKMGETIIPKGGKVSRKPDYVIFGEGTLTFAFNEWLTGNANVIIDHEGYVTVIGEITPQAEVELFSQKDFIKELPKFEARASYGIPVVGNIFLFVNVGLKLWAKMGPGKLYNIKVAGTYSTDPQKRNEFTIQGSLNISSGAGITLRGEGGAGLEILDHDIKAGAGVNAMAGIKGYVDATPIIGYREEGTDKKGIFFLKGEMEIAAQPFIGLSGDLFIEVDSPWWSPLPDKKWTWPLGAKEWPLGGNFGVGASVEYVLGSKQVPSVDFHKVDFSAEKFMTDLLHDKTKPKSGGAEDKKGKWNEKNSPSATLPPPVTKTPAGVKEGGPALEPAKSPVKPGGPKRKRDKKPPAEYAKEGKTPKEQEGLARDRAEKKKDVGDKAKDKEAGIPKELEKEKEDKWNRGVMAVKQALQHAQKEGIGLDELNNILKSIRRHKEYGFTKLEAKDEGETWDIHGSMSPDKNISKIKKATTKDEGKAGHYGTLPAKRGEFERHHIPQDKFMQFMKDEIVREKYEYDEWEKLKGWSRYKGIAIVMSKERHKKTRTHSGWLSREKATNAVKNAKVKIIENKIKEAKEEVVTLAKEEMKEDIENVKGIYLPEESNLRAKVDTGLSDVKNQNEAEYLS